MLAAEWAPTLHMLQRLALEKPAHQPPALVDSWIGLSDRDGAARTGGQGGGARPGAGGCEAVDGGDSAEEDLADRTRQTAAVASDCEDSRLFSQCLQALHEEISFWEGHGEDTAGTAERALDAQHGGSCNSTGRILQQLHKGRLIQKGGRLFSSLDGDPEVYTSSSEDDDESRDASCSGGCTGEGSSTKSLQIARHRFAAPVLPLRHALRFLRTRQRDSLRTRHLLTEWREGDGSLPDLKKVLSYWATEGVYSVAKAAQKMKTGTMASTPLQAKHVTQVLQQLDEVSASKAQRREFRQWASAAQHVLGGRAGGRGGAEGDCSFPLGLEALLVLAEEQAGRWFEGVSPTAVTALLDDGERTEVVKRLETLQGGGGPVGEQKTHGEKRKIEGSLEQQEELKKKVQAQVLRPPSCFSRHGNDTLRCPVCAFWLVQLRQLQQMQREGTCGLLAQAPATHFVRLMLVLQRERELSVHWAYRLAEGLQEDGFEVVRWLDDEEKKTKFYLGRSVGGNPLLDGPGLAPAVSL